MGLNHLDKLIRKVSIGYLKATLEQLARPPHHLAVFIHRADRIVPRAEHTVGIDKIVNADRQIRLRVGHLNQAALVAEHKPAQAVGKVPYGFHFRTAHVIPAALKRRNLALERTHRERAVPAVSILPGRGVPKGKEAIALNGVVKRAPGLRRRRLAEAGIRANHIRTRAARQLCTLCAGHKVVHQCLERRPFGKEAIGIDVRDVVAVHVQAALLLLRANCGGVKWHIHSRILPYIRPISLVALVITLSYILVTCAALW